HLLMTDSDTFQIWDVFASKKVRSVKHQHYVLVNGRYVGSVPTTNLSLAWSPDQRFVAAVAHGSAQVFEVASGKLSSHWTTDLYWTNAAWSRDSQQVATIALSNTAGSTVEVHSATTGHLLRSFPPPPRRPGRGTPRYAAISWSPDNRLLAAAGREEDDAILGVPGAVFLTIWSIASGEPLFTISYDPEDDLHHDSPGSLTTVWSSDGKQFALMSNAIGARLWTLPDDEGIQPLLTYIGSGGPYSQLAWSPESRYIALGDGDHREANVVRVFDTTTGQTCFSYRGHAGFISGLSWSPRGNYIASSSYDGVHVWQPEL
ncbi:MAG TPA: hypothetical protein VFA10_28050, partial [Ktedonobacteraceae bacterium]|nr:hypothetical protein [Ktedonobacteraceae bacterium]